MGVFKIDYSKKPDDKFDYWRFWVDLKGEPIYAKRNRNPVRFYQSHHEIALDILNQNRRMYVLWNELCKESEYNKWLSHARNFLVFYGYVLVDANDQSDNNIIFNSMTTPQKVLDQMRQDKTYNYFTEYDFAEEKAEYTDEERHQLEELHQIILKKRLEIEQKPGTVGTRKEDDEGR